MRTLIAPRRQRGATLVVALIMLALVTVIVTSAFTLSSTDMRAVGNVQMRDEAVAATNKAIEQLVSSPFAAAPAAESIDVDINNDGRSDYTVDFDAPSCVGAQELKGTASLPSSLNLGAAFAAAPTNYYQTVWDIDGQVQDPDTGTSVRVRQGVRVLMSEADYKAACK